MAIIEAVLSQTYQNQQVINRWYYVSSGSPGAESLSLSLAIAMGFDEATGSPAAFPDGTLARVLQQTQSAGVTFVSAAFRDLYSDTDFFEVPYPAGVTGTVGGTPATPALAYGFFTNRVRQSVRRGAKRITGVTEDAMLSGGAIANDYIAQLNVLASRMSAVLAYEGTSGTISFVPAVLAFKDYVTPSGKKAYAKYPSEAEQLQHTALNVVWSVQPFIRTQLSRQYGRGN